MNIINNPLLSNIGGKWLATCSSCQERSLYAAKGSALAMILRGSCRFCSKRHTAIKNEGIDLYKRQDGRWCSKCSGCGKEQAYTRKDHARQSSANDWQCKGCVSLCRGYSKNNAIGRERCLYNRYKKSAENRKIAWNLTPDQMFSCYTGVCALTGWKIDIGRNNNQTASLDRVNSNGCYEIGNIQWVHSMVNMSKNKYSQESFVSMCKAVANKAT